MDFELTDEQELVRSTVREFADAELAPVAAEVDRDHRFPEEVLPKMAGMNLMGMPWPEEYGGAGTDYVSYMIALEEVARACATTSVIMTAHTTLATAPIYKFGNDEQKSKYMYDMASGRRLGAFALTEPAAGTDAAAGTCTAVRDGDSYVLNGSKIFISNAPFAEIYIVFAKTDHRGAGHARVLRRRPRAQAGDPRVQHAAAVLHQLPHSRQRAAGQGGAGLQDRHEHAGRRTGRDRRAGPGHRRGGSRRGRRLLKGAHPVR